LSPLSPQDTPEAKRIRFPEIGEINPNRKGGEEAIPEVFPREGFIFGFLRKQSPPKN